MPLLTPHLLTSALNVKSETDAILVLQLVCDQYKFSRGFLAIYTSDRLNCRRMLDTGAQHDAWWPEYVTRLGTAHCLKVLKHLWEPSHPIIRLDRGPAGPSNQTAALMKRFNLADSVVLPIEEDKNMHGFLAFSGPLIAGSQEEIALRFVGYALFLQLERLDPNFAAESEALLTKRESEVVRLLIHGLTSKEVGAQLEISPRTVNQHVDNIAGKLGTNNRTQTIAEVLRRNILA